MSLSAPNDSRVTHHYADVGEVLLHYVTAGEGPPVVLIHGYPQTWWEWRHQIPVLAEKYTVIAPDMRGLGDSSRPVTGYDKKTIADDIWQVVNGTLGHELLPRGARLGRTDGLRFGRCAPGRCKTTGHHRRSNSWLWWRLLTRWAALASPIPHDARSTGSTHGRARGYLPCLVLSHLRLPARPMRRIADFRTPSPSDRMQSVRRTSQSDVRVGCRFHLFSYRPARCGRSWLQSLSRPCARRGRGRQSALLAAHLATAQTIFSGRPMRWSHAERSRLRRHELGSERVP